jgi:hypothetical protein
MGDPIIEDNQYVALSEIARRYHVSMSTMRRRIAEGKLFPGAKKVPAYIGDGEQWVIPRAEAEVLSLEELSPKVYRSRRVQSVVSEHASPQSDPEHLRSLEARVARLERLLLKCLDDSLSGATPSDSNVTRVTGDTLFKDVATYRFEETSSSLGDKLPDSATIRAWGERHGLKVPKRGRIGIELKRSYMSAHGVSQG